MLARVITAVAIIAGITSVASAQDVKLPEIDFGRYHALVIGNNEYQHVRNLVQTGIFWYHPGHRDDARP